MDDNNQAKGKLKVGMYWAASCGGCDISLLEIGPHLLELIQVAEVVFWPCVADFKYENVARYPDGYIDVMFYNGGVRNSEQEEVARLLRKKSKCLVAYGECAVDGGIPALANLKTPQAIYDSSYHENPSLDNPDGTEPQSITECPYGELEIPRLYPQVLRLQDVAHADYRIPGCPPSAERVWEVIQLIMGGKAPLENSGVVVGCYDKSVCDECPREKRMVKIEQFKRIHQARPEPGWCVLEQGIVCMGPATRSGCGALCIKGGVACEGCFGPSGESEDQGTAMIGALAPLLNATTEERATELVDQIVDPAGYFYRFTFGSSILRGRK